MSNRRLIRALYGPTWYEITFGLILSITLGAALAIVFLIFKPVETLAELPKADEVKDGMVYYVTGSKDYAKAKLWMRKRQMLLESKPGEVAFIEDDLNAWFSAGAEAKNASEQEAPKAPAPKQLTAKPAEPPAPEPVPEEILIPSTFNFRIRDGVVQVGLPTTINLLGYQFPVVAQARGGFSKQEEMYMFTPNEVMIGSLPLHRFPGAVEYMQERVLKSGALPEDLLAAWKRVVSLTVDDRTLRLTIQ